MTQHWYERDAGKDVSGRKHHVLPSTVVDLRKQMLNCVHRLPPLRDMQLALWPNRSDQNGLRVNNF
jgi:hypothetical protein